MRHQHTTVHSVGYTSGLALWKRAGPEAADREIARVAAARGARKLLSPIYTECVDDYPYDAKGRIAALIEALRAATQNDPEQEVQGMALPVLDAVIADVKGVLPDDLIVNVVEHVISLEAIGRGEPVRAVDALLVARQLDAAIGPYPLVIG